MATSLNRTALLFCLTAAGLGGCRSTGTIESTPAVTVTALNGNYETKKILGKTPVEVSTEDQDLGRYLITRDEGTRQYLLIIDPSNVSGKLTLETEAQGGGSYLLHSYNQYFDEVMRIHRLMLRGQFAEAKRLITKMNEEYDLTYGSLVLAGAIAVMENNQSLASEHFRMAKLLYPDDEVLKSLSP